VLFWHSHNEEWAELKNGKILGYIMETGVQTANPPKICDDVKQSLLGRLKNVI